jgi:hypothetical protein
MPEIAFVSSLPMGVIEDEGVRNGTTNLQH